MSIPTRELHDQPSNGADDLSDLTPQSAKRVEAVNDLIAYTIEIPLALIAAQDEHGQPDGSVSPYAMDVFAIEAVKPEISRSIVAIAADYPVFAAVLDRLSIGGPLVGLAISLLRLTAQLAENHGTLPDRIRPAVPGLIPRQQLAEVVITRAEAMKAQAQAS